MPRLSMNEMTTFRWSFEEDVQHYRAAGIPAIGVWRQKLADFGEERGNDLLEETGLAVSNLMWAGGFTGSEGHTHRESINDARDAIRLAGVLGAPCLVVYSGSRAGHTVNHAKRLVVSALKELAPIAEEANVRLAIEPMHGSCAAEWTFLTCVEETLSMLEKVNSKHIGLTFDTYHLSWHPEVLEALPKFVDKIAVVHLADGKSPQNGEQTRCRLGEGCLPLKETVAALTKAGFDGDYDVELMGPEIEQSDYSELLKHSVSAYERLMAGSAKSAVTAS